MVVKDYFKESFLLPEASCQSPLDIPNTTKSSSGLSSGSLTVYSCLSGYTARDAYNTIVCNGSHWTETNYSCIQGKQNVPVKLVCFCIFTIWT